jgi:hypothetical protein
VTFHEIGHCTQSGIESWSRRYGGSLDYICDFAVIILASRASLTFLQFATVAVSGYLFLSYWFLRDSRKSYMEYHTDGYAIKQLL